MIRMFSTAAAASVLVALVVAAAAPAAPSAAPVPGFQALLTEAGVTFTAPPDFDDVEVPAVAGFPFDRALRARSGAMQVMYAVRPIAHLRIDYNDPHSSAPNHIFPMVFESLTGVFSSGSHAPARQFSPQAAKQRFNADWASAATFDMDPTISPGYRLGFLVAAHKNNRADIYTLFLYNAPEEAKRRIDGLLFEPGV